MASHYTWGYTVYRAPVIYRAGVKIKKSSAISSGNYGNACIQYVEQRINLGSGFVDMRVTSNKGMVAVTY